MTSLRARLVLASMLVLSASTLSAQTSSRISCKDGSKPKIGHFSCWGHGGLVRETVKSAPKPASVAAKPTKVVAKPTKVAAKPTKVAAKHTKVAAKPAKKTKTAVKRVATTTRS